MMTVLTKLVTAAVLMAMALMSCSNGKSLQKYLVEKQDDDKFMKIDLATSLLKAKENTLSEDEMNILKTVKKINVVAYPMAEGNMANYEAEKQNISELLSQDKYKTLMKMGSNNQGATLKYVGEEDAIDELIVLASDDSKGFAVFRLLGDNMNPADMIKLMTSIEKGDVDIKSLQSIGDLFDVNLDEDTM
ncbi:MAG: hypothetical protein ACI86C_001947 [Candidatus Latescibacterota bacterium]|jgi:hypothetical protein